MSAEITIFEVPEQEFIINKTQKQLEYEELERSIGIDKDHIWSMYEMDEINSSSQRPASTLPSIMLKYTIQYCMPILDPTGESKYSISLQNDDRMLAIYKDRLVSIPSNEQFKVVGVKVPSLFIKNFNKGSLVHYDHVSDKDLALSGRYGLVDLQSMKFTQQRESFTHPGLPNIGEDKVMFTSDVHALQVCDLLLAYIEFIERYYKIHYPILKYDLVTPDVIGTNEYKWQILNGVLVDLDSGVGTSVSKTTAQKNSKPQKKPEMFVDFSKDLLKQLTTAQDSEFGSSFYYDVLFMLDANKLARLYNLGISVGTDTDSFKKEFNALKEHIKKRVEYQKQVNISHKVQLEIIKKKSIAFDKFGITDLMELSAAQNKIVALEFAKLESKSSESGESNRKLFNNLRRAMQNQTSEELVDLLKSIEKSNSAATLNANELLSGGVCPHSYHYAKKSLADFGRATAQLEIRDYLIEQFSLPNAGNGYFCKICGELLVEPDTTSSLKFSADRGMQEESPLQTMIWKEAMYIVSTNVRFITPMPVKPLVSSLASGLREVVATEESKLYRSKTNLGDTVKDTLNLYAAIYIYAALCALMLQNPGKMMFAREPPAEKQFTKKSPDGYLEPRNTQKKTDLDAEDNSEADVEDNSDADDHGYLEPPKTTKPVKQQMAIAAGPRKRRLRYIKGGKVVTDAKIAEKFYLTTALKLIFLSKETIISRLPNMSADVIKQIFIKNAYTWAVKHAKPIQMDDETVRQTSENPIHIDMFYRYVYLAKKLAPDGRKPNDLNDTKLLLGREDSKVLSDIKQDINMYSTVVAPKAWSMSDIPEFDSFTYKSFLSMLEYYQELLYTKSRVPRHVQVTEYFEKYKDLLDVQFRLRMYMAKKRLRPNIEIPLTQRAQHNNFAPGRIDLAKHFCPNGDQHKTGSYIYSNGKTTVELSKKEVVEWLNTNNTAKLAEFANLRVTDEKCEKCKQLIRSAKSLNMSDKGLLSMFGHIDDVLAFYQYYETRCPKGSLHDIQNNVCEKCKFDTGFVKTNDKSYYDKFKATFQKVQREKQSLAIRTLAQVAEERNLGVQSPNKEQDEYKYSLKKTAEWSQIAGVKYNLIANIGLYEKIKFVDLENALVNPSKTAEPSRTRALRLKNHILSVIRDYTMLLNHENVVDMPLELKDIFDAQKKIEIKGFIEAMPNFADFSDLDAKYSVTLSVENYTNFLQEYLADIMIRLNSDTHDKYKPMAKALIKHFTDLIIGKEKFISKPEPVFAKIAITAFEDNSEDEVGVSGDEYAGRNQSDASDRDDENAVETYENEISHEAFDVENADDVWENE